MRGSERTIEVKKALLIKELTKNRREHLRLYEEALQRYQTAMTNWLEARLADARAGRKVDRVIPYPVPENYVDHFDGVLEALAWEVNDTVTLDQYEFDRLVRNKWDWADRFHSNTEAYVAGVYDG